MLWWTIKKAGDVDHPLFRGACFVATTSLSGFGVSIEVFEDLHDTLNAADL